MQSHLGLEGTQKSPNSASSFSRSENWVPERSSNLRKVSTSSECHLSTSTVFLREGGRGGGRADSIPICLWIFQSASHTKSVYGVLLPWQVSIYRNWLVNEDFKVLQLEQLSSPPSVHSEWVVGVKTLEMGLLSSQRSWSFEGLDHRWKHGVGGLEPGAERPQCSTWQVSPACCNLAPWVSLTAEVYTFQWSSSLMTTTHKTKSARPEQPWLPQGAWGLRPQR